MDAHSSGGLYIALVLFGILVAVLWIALPFAIFGTKGLLKQLLSEQRKTNALLEARIKGTPPSDRAQR